MVRERIGKVFIDSCGHIWSTRFDKPKRCPGCFKKLDKFRCKKINKKQALIIFDMISNKNL